MTQQRVLEYIAEHGPIQMSKVEVDGMSRRAVSGAISRLMDNNSIIRHDDPEGNRRQILYSARLPDVEPENCFILRNLPREVMAIDG